MNEITTKNSEVPAATITTIEYQLKVIKDLGYMLDSKSKVLDFGCGAGNTIKAYRNKGFLNTFGCDIAAYSDDIESLIADGSVKMIETEPYRIPFDDNSFDLIVSAQVFEHVMNYEDVMSELKRVTKPGGMNLHIIPSRYVIREGHVYVPFATIIRNYLWLLFWAFLGIRNEYQKEMTPVETARNNKNYLENHTNYLTKGAIINQISIHFNNIIFCNKYIYGYGRVEPILKKYSKVFPFLKPLVYAFRTIRAIHSESQYWTFFNNE